MSDTPYGLGSRTWPGLAKVVEETSELTQVLMKLIATGGDTDYFDGTDLRERLVEEVADAQAAIDFLVVASVPEPDQDRIRERRRSKFHAYVSWHRAHLDQGELDL